MTVYCTDTLTEGLELLNEPDTSISLPLKSSAGYSAPFHASCLPLMSIAFPSEAVVSSTKATEALPRPLAAVISFVKSSLILGALFPLSASVTANVVSAAVEATVSAPSLFASLPQAESISIQSSAAVIFFKFIASSP